MQELLGRISRLDPQASLALRVIACFDELSVGNVNTRGLLSAAASLSGCVAGLGQDDPARVVRVSPRGELVAGEAVACTTVPASDGLTVWIERVGAPEANDAIILERLALAVRIRHGRGPRLGTRRDLAVLLDGDLPADDRRVAGAALGLTAPGRHRVVAAPLFAVWAEHPSVPEDVVPTRFGPVHVLVVPERCTGVDASPCGIGVATDLDGLPHSFRTALVALQLCEPPEVGLVHADDYAGLVDLLADAQPDARHPDVERVERVARHAWGPATLDAVVRSVTMREAARSAHVHHSTMQARLDTLTADLGFDPSDGFGRARAGVALLAWRLHRSRVLDLPAPARRPGGP